MSGKLYLIPTPIGNLSDMTFRAVEILKKVDLILAEDTRTSGVLLKHYEIDRPIRSYHQHNEHKITAGLLEQLGAGTVMALITDAGSPGVSDPGFLLARACIQTGIPIETLPGATAFVPALVNSGLPIDRFIFEGFLPHKKGRNKRLMQLPEEERTMVFYESPQRLLRTLEDLMQTFGEERKACVSRELTKLHEENIRGSLKELHSHFSQTKIRGEIVLVVAGKEK